MLDWKEKEKKKHTNTNQPTNNSPSEQWTRARENGKKNKQPLKKQAPFIRTFHRKTILLFLCYANSYHFCCFFFWFVALSFPFSCFFLHFCVCFCLKFFNRALLRLFCIDQITLNVCVKSNCVRSILNERHSKKNEFLSKMYSWLFLLERCFCTDFRHFFCANILFILRNIFDFLHLNEHYHVDVHPVQIKMLSFELKWNVQP